MLCDLSRGREAQSRWAVPSKKPHIFLIVSGVAGLHVSCPCTPVYVSPCSRDQHTHSEVPDGATVSFLRAEHCGTTSPLCVLRVLCAALHGRPPSLASALVPRNCILTAGTRSWKSSWRVTEGENSKFGKWDSFGWVFFPK